MCRFSVGGIIIIKASAEISSISAHPRQTHAVLQFTHTVTDSVVRNSDHLRLERFAASNEGGAPLELAGAAVAEGEAMASVLSM